MSLTFTEKARLSIFLLMLFDILVIITTQLFHPLSLDLLRVGFVTLLIADTVAVVTVLSQNDRSAKSWYVMIIIAALQLETASLSYNYSQFSVIQDLETLILVILFHCMGTFSLIRLLQPEPRAMNWMRLDFGTGYYHYDGSEPPATKNGLRAKMLTMPAVFYISGSKKVDDTRMMYGKIGKESVLVSILELWLNY